MSDKKDVLRKRVLKFIKSQPGYNLQVREKLRITFEKQGFLIIYGKDEMAGILGFGYSVDLAYDDFVRSWEHLRGFEWIKKNLS